MAYPPRSGRLGPRDRDPDSQGDDQDKAPAEPAGGGPALRNAESALSSWLDRLEAFLPRSAADFGRQNLSEFDQETQGVEGWSAETARFDPPPTPEELKQIVNLLLDSKDRVDRALNRTLNLRIGLAALDKSMQHDSVRHFLATTSGLIDLSGRLRYLLFDALNYAAEEGSELPAARDQFLDVLTAHRSSIGAVVAVGALLFDPVSTDPAERIEPMPASVKRKVLNLVAATGQMDLLPQVAAFARDPRTTPGLLLAAAETIRMVGLPQDVRPGQDPEAPKPAITARELHDLLAKVAADRWSADEQPRVDELLSWLDERAKKGLSEDRLRLGRFDVQPGDWLLMRNPSPYNLFTDLSPGLFTHVGVVAAETGTDGIRRLVLVDLPERGTRMPATNVDAFVARSLHYMFLRHPDPAVAQKMGETAAELIGAPTEFDLNFRTDHVTALKGQPLKGKKIHAYCAGFLLLCAQDTGRPREEFFPIPEGPAAGNTRENLAKIGITFGQNFISPTGALFSPKLQIVGQREPMYDSQREVEEAIYDYFAESLKTKTLVATPDLFQSMRLKMAEASKTNPLLAKAIADAAHVDQDLDLVSAAKTQAVVEDLDNIAYGNSREYLLARQAILAGPKPAPVAGQTAEQTAQLAELREKFSSLAQFWDADKLSPRALRIALVKYYIRSGKAQLDTKFFSGGASGR
ncbi:MAG TPA: hypothetical protein VHX65_13750 [Pirellulales bacterium]|nr:hypothetical protein [Pirellulales bacterium]